MPAIPKKPEQPEEPTAEDLAATAEAENDLANGDSAPPSDPEESPAESKEDKILSILEGMSRDALATRSTVQSLADRVEALEQPADEPEEAAPLPSVPTLPEGVVRFRSKYKDFRVEMKKTVRSIVNGEVIVVPGKWLEFNRGVFDTSDPDEIEFLRGKKYFGQTLFEDPTAQPAPGPQVVTGPKSSGSHVRVTERPAELAARL